MNSLLYSISGLPIHALVVHFAVVVLPLAAIGLIVIIYRPSLKGKYAFLATCGVVLGSAAVLIAKQSGEALSEHIGLPLEHADYGTLLTYSAFVFMVLTLFWYRSKRGRAARSTSPLSHLTALAGIAVLGLTFLTGHSGAQSVWEAKLAAVDHPDVKGSSSLAPTNSAYTLGDLKKHSTASSCWSAVNGSVYDLTQWIGKHPGGQNVIKALCGVDGSTSFNNQHGGQSRPESALIPYKIGKLI